MNEYFLQVGIVDWWAFLSLNNAKTNSLIILSLLKWGLWSQISVRPFPIAKENPEFWEWYWDYLFTNIALLNEVRKRTEEREHLSTQTGIIRKEKDEYWCIYIYMYKNLIPAPHQIHSTEMQSTSMDTSNGPISSFSIGCIEAEN